MTPNDTDAGGRSADQTAASRGSGGLPLPPLPPGPR